MHVPMGSPIVIEDHGRTLKVLEQVFSAVGLETRTLSDPARLKLEIRGSEPTAFFVSAEAFDGRAFDLVRDHYGECRAPLPVIAWSAKESTDHLKNLVPIELRLCAALSVPLDPAELVRAVLDIGLLAEPARAQAILADVGADGRATHARLDAPAGRYDLAAVPAPRIFVGAAMHQWTGRVSIDLPTGGMSFWFDKGEILYARSDEGADLVRTLQGGRKLRVDPPPASALQTLDEEVGFLLATRAVGFHEVGTLQGETLSRLVGEVLAADKGAVHGVVGERPASRFEKGKSGAALVIQASKAAQAQGQDRGLGTHADAVVVVRLPAKEALQSLGLSLDDRRVIEAVEKARGRDVGLDQLLRVVASEPERRNDARALLNVLRALGFIDFRGRPFDHETEELLERFTKELHRVQRANPFVVLGLDTNASDQDIREAMRTFAKTWHPDNFFEKHRRVQRAADALFARVQEAYDSVKTPALREAQRTKATTGEKSKDEGRRDPTQAKVSLAQGKLFLRNKKLEEARDSFRDATLLDHSNAEARALYGWSRFVCDPSTSAAAVKDLDAAAALDPKSPEPAYYLGRIALMQKDTARAQKAFQKALTIKPDHVDAQREMRLLERRSQGDGEAGSASIFGSIFQRKKPGGE